MVVLCCPQSDDVSSGSEPVQLYPVLKGAESNPLDPIAEGSGVDPITEVDDLA